MTAEEIVNALKCLRVQTGGLACMGCESGSNCGVHGCAIMRQAAELIERLEKEKAALSGEMEDARLCVGCQHYSWCIEYGREESSCFVCDLASGCPCADCIDASNWVWKGLVDDD